MPYIKPRYRKGRSDYACSRKRCYADYLKEYQKKLPTIDLEAVRKRLEREKAEKRAREL